MNTFSKISVVVCALGSGTAHAADPVAVTIVSDLPSGAATGVMPRGTALIRGPLGVMYGSTESGGAHSSGAIFAVTPSGTASGVASFDFSTLGSSPWRNMVRDAAGNLYAAVDGNSTARGRIVKITAAGKVTVLHAFATSAGEGQIVGNSLTLGADGLLYGVTESGGTDGSGCGTFFHLAINGTGFTVSNLGQGAAYTGPCEPLDGLAQGPDGNFYGLAAYDANGIGAYSGSIFRITPAGAVSGLYVFKDRTQEPPTGTPVVDDKGVLYFFGGVRTSNMSGRVYRFEPGVGLSVLHQFSATDGAPGPYTTRLLLHTDGRLYGVTSNGGLNGGAVSTYFNDGVVFSLGRDGSFAVLHNFGADATDGKAPEAPLTRAADGTLWGTTPNGGGHGNGTVFRLAKPVARLAASPSSILSGASAKLTWTSANTTDCAVTSGGAPVGAGTHGSQVVTPAATTSYALVCHGAGTVQKSVTVTVN